VSDRDDDEGHDDPMLRQMRAVWLSMRDEEPPQSGLSALLVAAREKAEQMRPKQSLWSRFLAGMRRPPVLALATVVVLLGGAIALTTRSDSLEVNDSDDKRMKAPAMPSPVQPPAEPPTTATVPADQGELQKAGDETRTPPVAQEAPPARERPPTPPRQRPNTATAKPVRPPAASPDRGFGGDGVAGRLEQAPPQPAPPPPAKAGEKKSEGKLSIATDDDATPRNEPAPAGAPMEDASATAEAPKQQAQQPAAAQLVQQCETAATRGDCAAVRVIAERIRKLDGAIYRDRVQKNAAIARCLK